MFNQKKSKLMQTKGQLMKSLHTAFSFAPPSILSLTIYRIKLKLVIIKEAVKIHVEFYSFLCIIEVEETI